MILALSSSAGEVRPLPFDLLPCGSPNCIISCNRALPPTSSILILMAVTHKSESD